MDTMRYRTLALLVCLAYPLMVEAQETPSLVGQLMTPQQFRAAGLYKLTAAELKALDMWVVNIITARRQESLSSAKVRADDLDSLEGCEIVADDGQFLGIISRNTVDSRSIANTVGRYGSSVSSTSIFNTVGKYGSTVSRLSPFNSITRTPPSVRCAERFTAFLTANSLKTPSVDPDALKNWIGRED